MKTIFKYALTFDGNDVATVNLPIGAQVLHVDLQKTTVGKIPTLWALVDTDAESCARKFRIAGTGHDLSAHTSLLFINTVFDQQFVWHFFEVFDAD